MSNGEKKKKINGKVVLLIVGVLAIIGFIIFRVVKSNAEEKALEDEAAARVAAMTAKKATPTPAPVTSNDPVVTKTPTGDTDTTEVVIVDKLQQELEKKYGKCPDGFKWTRAGKMVPTGSSEYTSEEVLYIYFRGLSMQDFTVVERYSSKSDVVSQYRSFRKNSNGSSYKYFLSRQFTAALSHLQLEEDSDVAIFANGEEYHNVVYTTLDFTNKDFYLEDRDSLFLELAEMKRVEGDSEKIKARIYDYIIEKYNSGTFPIKTYNVEIKLEIPKDSEGFLVTDDVAFCGQLQYEKGVDAAEYMLDDFEDYYKEYRKSTK